MRIFVSLFLLLLFNSCASLHHSNLPTSILITQFPFTILTGGTVILKAQLEDYKDSLNFVFDTGSGGISLDSSTIEYLNIKSTKSNTTIRGIAGIRKVNFVYKRSLKFSGLQVDSLDFHINNYDILTSSYGLKVDGVIGLSFLRRYIVMVNYDTRIIEVYTPGKIKYPRGGHLLKPIFYGLPVISTDVLDNTLTQGEFIFDTGAGLNMLLNEDYVKDSSLLKKNRKLFVTQAEGLGGKKAMKITVIKRIEIGPYKFRKVPIYIFKDDFNITNYPKMGGVIGNDILRRFNLILNYPYQEIYIRPNTHFYDDFDYSYTGLGLYQIDGEIYVEDVVEPSPAHKAGLIPGDIIVAIDNTFTNSLQVYKHILQNAGNTVKLLVKRSGDLIILNLEIQHIMH